VINLRFFSTNFWQNIFSKEMWRNVKPGVIKPVSARTIFWYTPYRSQVKFISPSDKANFVVRLSTYQGVIWCISASEIGRFASRNGVYCKAGKYPLNINYWHSIHYINFSYSVYLYQKEMLFANTRLFFRVEQETKIEKTKYAYNLNVAHIGLI